MRRQELLIFIGVIIFVAIIFFSYVLFSLFPTSKQPESGPSPIPRAKPQTSTRPFDNFILSPSPTPLPVASSPVTKDNLINLLPIITDTFDIEYLSIGDIFAVTIKKNPYQENLVKAEQWFRDQGFNPTDLKIYWNKYPEVER